MTTGTSPLLIAPRERFAWVLLPLALIAYGCALLSLLTVLIGVSSTVAAATSDAPIPVTLHAAADLVASQGTHSYSGGPFIADGAQVTATVVTTEVSGADTPTRIALRLGPTLWAATTVLVASAIGLLLARLRARDPRRIASRPALLATVGLAAGSTIAQLVTAWANMRLGHVAWIGQHGLTGFTAINDTVFDFTPLVLAAALLALTVVVRRVEHAPSDT